jgi:hypothetical protein
MTAAANRAQRAAIIAPVDVASERPPVARQRRERLAVMAVVALIILARAAIFVLWPHAQFDSDQAVTGLMAKHLGEGRAFPLFMYGQNYILGVEAWMAAAVFFFTGPSVTGLKLPLLAVNFATAFLLLRQLERDGRLRPALAAIAIVWFVLPPPSTAAMFVDASGTSIEPFLYIPLLWVARRRPVLFGAIFAIGFLQREFTVFAPIALVIVAAATGDLFDRAHLRRALAAVLAAAAVWAAVTLAKPYASAFGPDTSIAELRAPSNNVLDALRRVCFDPTTIVDGVARFLSVHWGRLFGTAVNPLWEFGIESRGSQGFLGLGWLLAAAMLFAAVRIVTALAAAKRLRRDQAFSAYLTTVGVLTAAAVVVARCGAQGPTRYALLSIYAIVGLSAWYLAIERFRPARTAWLASVAVWALVSAAGHGRLWIEYLRAPPVAAKQQIIEHLQARGIKYAIADYWIAYYVSFLTREGIIVTPSDFPRIGVHVRMVQAHQAEAVRIARTPCPGGEEVIAGVYFCGP